MKRRRSFRLSTQIGRLSLEEVMRTEVTEETAWNGIISFDLSSHSVSRACLPRWSLGNVFASRSKVHGFKPD